MKNILVTGGAGFIGSHLVKKLIEIGYKVRVLDNLSEQIHNDLSAPYSWATDLGVELIKGCITSRKDVQFALEGINSIIHLAAETGTGQSMYEVERYNRINTLGTAVLLDVIANSPQLNIERILLASSRSVYGEGAFVCDNCSPLQRLNPQPRSSEQLANGIWEPQCKNCEKSLKSIPTKESDTINPASIYAVTKFTQEELVRIFCSSLGIGYGILRLQNVYGEGQSLNNPYTGILSIFSTRIRMGVELPIFEDGLETRDFVHISDVVRAFISALQSDNAINTVVNVGTGITTTVSEVAKELSLAFGKKPNIVITGEYRLGDIRHNSADVIKLNKLLACNPEVNLSSGLKSFSDWVLTQKLPDDRLAMANEELKDKGLMK